MAAPHDQPGTAAATTATDPRAAVKRRGLIAGVAGLAAGLLAARASEQTVTAADPNDVVKNTANTTVAYTGIAGSATTWTGSTLFGADASQITTATNVAGMSGTANGAGYGVIGFGGAAGGAGILGRGEGSIGASGGGGVVGIASGASIPAGGTFKAGVYGTGNGGSCPGVWGNAQTLDGVRGVSASGSGVAGISTGGYGGYGVSTSSTAVYGLSTNSYGGVFITGSTAPGQYGVLGGANGAGVSAFGGANPNAGGYAAYFTGNVKITGGKLFLDSQTLQSLNAHADGTKRVTYGAQGTEPVIEDVGEATLAGGKADVALDPAFAGLIATDGYHVFLTPRFDTKGLYVAEQTAAGFTVREVQGGTGGGAFAWRVVAKPRGAGKAQRLAKHDLADLTMPSIEELTRKPTPGAETPSAPPPAPPSGGGGTPPKATQQPTATAAPPLPTAKPSNPTTGGQAPNPAPSPRTP